MCQVTLWNDMRLAYNMPPMGFLNPFLYKAAATNPEAFNDIVTGDNACSAGGGVETVNCCEYSFSAQPGWDATTGLGSPNYGVLANLVLNSDSMFPALDAGNYGEETSSSSSSNDDRDDEIDQNRDMSIAALVLVLLTMLCTGYIFITTKMSARGTDTWSNRDPTNNPLTSGY